MMISNTITIQLFATFAMFVNIDANAVDGNTASCSCGEMTNLLICKDDDDKLICFCDEDGNVYCDGDQTEPPAPTPVPAPVVIESTAALPVAPTPAPTFHTIDGCFCSKDSNVLSCDDPLKKDYCFCNEDNDLRCSTGTLSMEEETEADGNTASCFCGRKTNVLFCEFEEDELICFCDEDGNVYCNKQTEPSALLPVRIFIESAPSPAAPPFHTIDGCFCDKFSNVLSCKDTLNEEYCFCNEDNNLRCKEEADDSYVVEAFSLSVNTSGSINIVSGTYLASIAIMTTGLLFL
jgi:hypothetical protein